MGTCMNVPLLREGWLTDTCQQCEIIICYQSLYQNTVKPAYNGNLKELNIFQFKTGFHLTPVLPARQKKVLNGVFYLWSESQDWNLCTPHSTDFQFYLFFPISIYPFSVVQYYICTLLVTKINYFLFDRNACLYLMYPGVVHDDLSGTCASV